MPESAGSDASGILHHAIIRGIERQYIFRDKADKEDFVGRLSQLVPRNPYKLLCMHRQTRLPQLFFVLES
jgi:hypothetical protein